MRLTLLLFALLSSVVTATVPNPFASTGTKADATSAASSLTPQSVSTLFLLEALQRHNSSGALPPIPRLNELLRQANGQGALQVPESGTAFEAAAPNGGGAVDVLSAMLSQYGAGAGTATGFPASRPPMFGAGTDGSVRTAAFVPPVAPAGAPAGPPDLSPLLGTLLLAPQGESVNSEMAMAVRAVRFGLYDALYGLLNYAGQANNSTPERVGIPRHFRVTANSSDSHFHSALQATRFSLSATSSASSTSTSDSYCSPSARSCKR